MDGWERPFTQKMAVCVQCQTKSHLWLISTYIPWVIKPNWKLLLSMTLSFYVLRWKWGGKRRSGSCRTIHQETQDKGCTICANTLTFKQQKTELELGNIHQSNAWLLLIKCIYLITFWLGFMTPDSLSTLFVLVWGIPTPEWGHFDLTLSHCPDWEGFP